MQRVSATGPTVLGIDVSHYEPSIDWDTAKSKGNVQFMMAKATEGATSDKDDSVFLTHMANSRKAGVLNGAYHFFHPNQDPVAQAKLFASRLQAAGPVDIRPILDWEVDGGVLPQQEIRCALICLQNIAQLTGRKPMIYTMPSFFDTLNSGQIFADYDVWIANPGHDAPLLPSPFKKWTFFQYTFDGVIPGCGRSVDANWFNGTLDQLKSLG